MEEYKGPAAYWEGGEEERQKQELIARLTPLVKDIVMVVVKTVKATKLYLPNNPIYQKFRDELKEKFDKYFQYEDMLSLAVRRFELLFLDQQVYNNPDKEDNIALMFFKDGVREFCFHNDITPEEIDGFIEILKFDMKERELDDDLVTLLWEKDFKSITYTVTEEATEDEAFEEESLLSFGGAPEDLRQLDELRARAADYAREPGGADAASDFPEVSYQTAQVAPEHVYGISAPDSEEDDYVAIRGSYGPPDDLSLLNELTDILYEILITEKSDDNFNVVVESLSRALEIFVMRGDLALATILVMKVQDLILNGGMADDRAAELDSVVNRAASEKLVGRVGEFIEQGGQEALEAAGSYLTQLDSRAIPPTVKLLETVSSRRTRKAVCDIAQSQCGGNGKLLLPFLSGEPWYVIRNVVMILGKVGDADTVQAIGGSLKHNDPRVRREAINALLAIKGKRAEEFIAGALSDADKSVRVLSARVLAELSPEKAYERLMHMASEKGFDGHEFDEKKEIYEIIGRIGKEKAFSFFARQFEKKGFLGLQKFEKERALAAYGLAACGTGEAYAVLQSEIDSKSKPVRAACLEGLRRMKK